MKQLRVHSSVKRNAVPNFTGYQPRKLSGIEAMAFIGLITEAFPVEERDIISHWFRTLTD